MVFSTSFWSKRSVVSALFNPPVAAEIPRKIMRSVSKIVTEMLLSDVAVLFMKEPNLSGK